MARLAAGAVDLALRDGSTVQVRPAAEGDQPALDGFLSGLSEESRTFRFFGPGQDLGWAAERFAHPGRGTHSLVAVHGSPEAIVAHGYCAPTRPGVAEMAVAVADAYQGRGLGTALLGRLAELAAADGIETFEAEVMAANHRMLDVLRESGFPLRTSPSAGVIHVEFPTSLTPDARDRFERREQLSAIAALSAFLRPEAVAVVGASRRRGTVGGELFHNLLTSGFPGPVYPVSPHPVVQSVPAYPDLGALPQRVDLAVVAVPAARVLDVARDCAAHGVRALVVISAGFAESGEEGRQRQAELLDVCRRSGMRLIGPNCMGILNTDPEHALNATFGPTAPPPGRVGFLSQSGALGLAVIDGARRLGLGISSFVSVGNKADISGNDLLEYWEADDATDVLLLYLESFGNPRRFSRLARRVSRTKPIVAVKAGRSLAGVRATSSHTGALLATSDVTVDALFRQSGVIRVDDLGELYDVASLLASQPPPAGRRVGILTNAGGLGILCADACAADGLEVPELSEGLRRRLGEFLPAEASLANPVDMIASASGDDYERALGLLGASDELDALIVIFIPPLLARAEGASAGSTSAGSTEETIERAAGAVSGRPVVAVLPSAAGAAPRGRVPTYGFPENAVRALARSATWAAWQRAPDAPPPALEARRDEARAVVAAALGSRTHWLDPDAVARVLDCYGIPMAEWRLAPDAEGAVRAARELGGAVALKAVAPTLVHKTDVGGVRLGLEGAEAVRDGARSVEAAVRGRGHRLDAFLVQRMAEPGVEMLVGVVQDPVFGGVVACGAGGAAAELLRDVRVSLAPLTEAEAHTMIRSLATFPLLDGYRGAPRSDVSALEDVLLRVGALATDLPEIVELDLNPVAVGPGGARVLDARMRVQG